MSLQVRVSEPCSPAGASLGGDHRREHDGDRPLQRLTSTPLSRGLQVSLCCSFSPEVCPYLWFAGQLLPVICKQFFLEVGLSLFFWSIDDCDTGNALPVIWKSVFTCDLQVSINSIQIMENPRTKLLWDFYCTHLRSYR